MKRLSALLIPLMMAGCAIVNDTYDEDGRPVHEILCGTGVPGVCYNKAAEICPNGYYTVDKNMDSDVWSTSKRLTVSCK